MSDHASLITNEAGQDLTSLTLEAARLLVATLKDIESDTNQAREFRNIIMEQREKLEKELDSEAPSILKIKTAMEAVKDLREICSPLDDGVDASN
ncbi:hypothetical protein [Azohydromonas caseinilytica]|uniref:Uncharacterized protein n=1 Tax=Azohydromonas caseinilytica TaxID=2728836 RepID=A0A848FHF2_9BURK|nr:hypothetical protein [Azohydromonas caseinilytica]NML17719.1 hypothetical protein [Azohydromonas caseinilytica]